MGEFVLIIVGILMLAAFDRLFMPPLNPWGRAPLGDVLLGFMTGATEGVLAAKRMEETFQAQQKRDIETALGRGGRDRG